MYFGLLGYYRLASISQACQSPGARAEDRVGGWARACAAKSSTSHAPEASAHCIARANVLSLGVQHQEQTSRYEQNHKMRATQRLGRKRPFYTPCRPRDPRGIMNFHRFCWTWGSQNPEEIVVFLLKPVNLKPDSDPTSNPDPYTTRVGCLGVPQTAWSIERVVPIRKTRMEGSYDKNVFLGDIIRVINS